MHSWPNPEIPALPDYQTAFGGPQHPADRFALKLYDHADDAVREVEAGDTAGVYVCGITPYDATHLGHAATYAAFDLVNRLLLAQGKDVHFVQNVTDVDDPLFERAERDQVDWRELGDSQVDLFRADMTALGVIPPRDYVSVTESIDDVIELVGRLLENGAAYIVESSEYPDIYARVGATTQFGYESRYDYETMLELFAERGGDPESPGKEHPLDALIWRAHRPGEPQWEAPFGAGRPGWHVECSAIAATRLGEKLTIQGGGNDLIFPHHEFSAAHYEAAHDSSRMFGHYSHAGMIALDGVKMSKSLGNLVFVSVLLAEGVDPAAIRLSLYLSHYRSDRSWSYHDLAEAWAHLLLWQAACQVTTDESAALLAAAEFHAQLANDLDTPAAITALDSWATEVLRTQATIDSGAVDSAVTAASVLAGVSFASIPEAAADSLSTPGAFTEAGAVIASTVDALTGIQLAEVELAPSHQAITSLLAKHAGEEDAVTIRLSDAGVVREH